MEKKRIILPFCFLIICIGVVVSFSFAKSKKDEKPVLNVLMLHMVTEEMPEDKSLNGLYITTDMLRKYCEYFKERYTIVSLDEAYDIIKNNESISNPKMLAFTFDDGYDNNYTLAYPILKEYGIKANINIIAKYTDENYQGYLTWDQIKEMAESGLITFGSHTYNSHYYSTTYEGEEKPVLAALLPDETDAERKERIFSDLRLADKMISDAVGKKINIMTYPYGVPPFDLMDDIANEFGYNIQILVRKGGNRGTDMFSKLRRFTVKGDQEPQELDSIIKKYNGIM